MTEDNNETWLIDAGDIVINKEAKQGYVSLSQSSGWVADYGMRNVGDLVAALDLYPPFQEEARLAAMELGFPRSIAAFSLSTKDLEERYFQLFDGLCQEIRGA